MKKHIFTLALVITITIMATGCGGKLRKPTGFLSDYSKLKQESANTMRYRNDAALKKYDKLIVDPIQTRIENRDEALTDEDIADLTSYMYDKITEAIRNSGDNLVYRPAEGVLRFRIAFTDIGKSHPVSMLPQGSITGVGVGGASIEAELIDSVTGEQIAAIVQSKKGEAKVPFTAMGDWTAAKQSIDAWAKALEKRLSEK
jgi:hypothetical protein